LGFSEGDSRNSLRFLRHAGRELDVELFDGEFAGDEAGEKSITRKHENLVLPYEVQKLVKEASVKEVKSGDQIIV
jgi:hypothetical protein